jgi:hypothetical protein
MKCDMCRYNGMESKGLRCGKYNVCSPCIDKSIEARMFLIGRDKQ